MAACPSCRLLPALLSDLLECTAAFVQCGLLPGEGLPTLHHRSGFEYILAKHVTKAADRCPSLNKKHVSPHVLRHSRLTRRIDVQTINQFAKFPARFEEGNILRRHCDPRSGFWIASDARTSLARVEASESADFNLVAGSQGTDDTVKYGANDDFGFLPGHLNGLMNLFGQIGSGHLAHLRWITKKEYHNVPWYMAPAQRSGQSSHVVQ
jgi:hypothetical protein